MPVIHTGAVGTYFTVPVINFLWNENKIFNFLFLQLVNSGSVKPGRLVLFVSVVCPRPPPPPSTKGNFVRVLWPLCGHPWPACALRPLALFKKLLRTPVCVKLRYYWYFIICLSSMAGTHADRQRRAGYWREDCSSRDRRILQVRNNQFDWWINFSLIDGSTNICRFPVGG